MALSALIASIRQSADHDIARIQDRVLREKQELHAKTEALKNELRSAHENKRKERSSSLVRKVTAMIERERKQAILREKRSALDRVYAETLKTLSSIPEKEVSPLLDRILASIKGDMTILPTSVHAKLIPTLPHYKKERMNMGTPIDATGGFRVFKESYEQDFTFERLLHDDLRPQTEQEIAATLFSS